MWKTNKLLNYLGITWGLGWSAENPKTETDVQSVCDDRLRTSRGT